MSPPAFAPKECYSTDYATRRACRDACTIEICPLKLSFWAGYIPSLPANSLFAALFGLTLILFLVQAVWSRKFIAFSVAMISGSVLELLGYIGRIMAHSKPFDETSFLIQIVCLTIAPAFYAAGLYFCLSRIVETFGAENSRLKPGLYPKIFIPCDLFSLVLQALGGGMASAATHSGKNAEPGNHIMLAGLAVQVVTLFFYIMLASDFAFRTYRRISTLGKSHALDPTHAKLRDSLRFRGFVCALIFATLCIFTRSVYRVAELSEGWSGHLILTQKYFIGLEGAIVAAGILSLNVFHPGLCFTEGYVKKEKVRGQRKSWFAKKNKRVGADA
ncbi:hypothetical protein FKW77_009037 [Venturia effusa]|uniref:RTA1-domain-containing protein n=1 Tax=Venturia effusa TaxID=50376 RepID=A0A517L1X8_9PEZI|nr:hypothetical protein FKW77_009037 [Venturia effusa]